MPFDPASRSEIASLRERIAREYEMAGWARLGLTIGTAQHHFINRRYARIGLCQEQLATMIGEQASLEMVVEIIESSPVQKKV